MVGPELARDCPPDGLRISPKSAPGHRPALYFVDRLERAIAGRFRAWLFAELGTGRTWRPASPQDDLESQPV